MKRIALMLLLSMFAIGASANRSYGIALRRWYKASEYFKEGMVNFYLDDLDIYISSDPYGWTAGVERDSDIIYFSVLVDENEGSSRGTKFSFDELLTLVKKRNFAEIKKIALEIQNDKTLKLNSEL